MDNKLINKVITISSEETKKTQYGLVKKIKDENGLTYSIFDTKKDGSESAAWAQYKDLSIGDTVQISYVEEPKEFEGKRYMARTIRNFSKDIGNGVKNAREYQHSQTSGNARPEANSRSTESPRESNTAFGQRLAIHGMVNGMLAAGKTPAEVEESLGQLLRLEDAIADALNTPSDYMDDDLPTIHADDTVNVEDIPF